MGSLGIVIPCYNEEKHFAFSEYSSFLKQHSDVSLCLVNDGSEDRTLDLLNKLKHDFGSQVYVVDLKDNSGKSEAVRAGMLHFCNVSNLGVLAYIDADLAVTLQECFEMKSFIEEYDFCFGSRVLRVGARIERKFSRFFIGRIIATVISKLLRLAVYDTQCGCKLLKKELAQKVFQEKFISKWLFDVEIFFRIFQFYGKKTAISKMIEVPLKQWIDKGDSKVKLTYFFKIFSDLYRIRKRYK